MIRQDTVFNLGAGSSMPFKFPSGGKLIKNIHRNLGSGSRKKNFYELGFDDKIIDSFRLALLSSNLPSIDEFLRFRKEFLSIGKVAITQELIQHELEENLISFNESWLRHFFNYLVQDSGFSSFLYNKISFITFNYDRSLEHFLFTSLKNTYGEDDNRISIILKKTPIIHIHGKLGDLPWQNKNLSRPYNPTLGKYSNLLEVAQNLRIIFESKSDMNELDLIFNMLQKAKRIYFLGFGYHKQNLELLRIKELKNNTIGGTTFGLTRKEIADVKNIYPGKLSGIDDEGYDILNYFRERIRLN